MYGAQCVRYVTFSEIDNILKGVSLNWGGRGGWGGVRPNISLWAKGTSNRHFKMMVEGALGP